MADDAATPRHVRVDDLPDVPAPTDHKKEIDEAVGATEFGFNLYVAQPGQRIPWGYHRHPDHEEAFYVLEGEVVFETPDGEFDVGAGEAFFVPRGTFQRARAVGSTPTRLLAVGAPKASDGAEIREPCPACGEETARDVERAEEDGVTVYVLSCASCGAETDRLRPGPA